MAVVRVRPEGAGLRRLGHFGFFRPALRDTLWPRERAWLLDQLQRST